MDHDKYILHESGILVIYLGFVLAGLQYVLSHNVKIESRQIDQSGCLFCNCSHGNYDVITMHVIIRC